MNFYGLQKMTLLDYPGRVACTVFTGGCNFRCPFCHNALLVTNLDQNTAISEEEILTFLQKRKGLLDGVCITGGEPLIQTGIFDFIGKVKSLGYNVKLDTNGSFPGTLKRLVSERLIDYVAIDIKNVPEKYAMTVGIDNFDYSPVRESIDFLLTDTIPYEFRTTVTKELHTVEDIAGIAESISGASAYFIQNFSDSGNIIGQNLSPCDQDTLYAMERAASKFIKKASLRGV